MLHQIGSGVLGAVFRGFDPQRDRIVAIKAFKLDLLPEDVARLAASLRRLAGTGFTHRYHVGLIDAGLEGTTPFQVSEYISGETLDVARRQLANAPAMTSMPWLRQLAEAMDEAHRAGLLHGSLHPRDVLIAGRTSEVRVTGFGVVGALESVGARTPIRRPYTAPERTSGEPWNTRADLYSLAAIAHELLTGRRPAGPGEQDGALAGGLSPEQRVAVRKVLATGLAERPEARFDSAASFVQAIETAVTGGQPELPIAPPVEARPQPETTAVVPIPTRESLESTRESIEVPVVSEAKESEPREPAPTAPLVIVAPVEPAEVVAPEVLEKPAPPTIVAPPAPEPPAPTPAAEKPRVPPAVLPLPATRPEIRGHDILTIRERPEPVPFTPPPEPTPYPWTAIAAVGLAGLIVGGVLGYRTGMWQSPSRAAVPAPTSAAAPGAAETEVAVAQPTPAPPQAEPGSSAPIEPRAERATAPATGRLIVQSAPTGALVTVNGQYRGETPLTIRDIPLGAHTVQIARPGHIPWTDRVTLTSSAPARVVAADLQPGLDMNGRVTGSLYIDSRPRGARVMIDGRFVGTTPFRMPGLAAGRHDIRLELDGYRAALMPVSVAAGRESRVAITLDPGAALPGGRGPVR